MARKRYLKVNGYNYYGPPGIFQSHKPYGFGAFLLDAFLTIITAGAWLLFLIIQWLRGRY